MESIEYLGFLCTLDGLSMDPAKVACIQNWPEPPESLQCSILSNSQLTMDSEGLLCKDGQVFVPDADDL
jgi:hypothetical protein